MTTRTDKEISDQLERAHQAHQGQQKGSNWPGMTFEDGVIATIEWITGYVDEAPMDDE